jgi:2-methylcitrate dehydratase PrpD
VGCAIGGANGPGNRELIDLVKGWGGKGEATILMHGGKVLVQDAAMINAVMVRSYDFEEQSPSAHQNATIIPVALAMGEMKQLNGKDFLTALIWEQILGTASMRALTSTFSTAGTNIGSLHTLRLGGIAGRILGLTPEQLRNAFGLALHQTAGSIQSYWDCDTTYKLNNGFAARSGILCGGAGQNRTGGDDRRPAGPARLLQSVYARLHASGENNGGPG